MVLNVSAFIAMELATALAWVSHSCRILSAALISAWRMAIAWTSSSDNRPMIAPSVLLSAVAPNLGGWTGPSLLIFTAGSVATDTDNSDTMSPGRGTYRLAHASSRTYPPHQAGAATALTRHPSSSRAMTGHK